MVASASSSKPVWVFDCHVDIADSVLYTAHGDFFRKNGLHEGWNDLGIPVNNQTDKVRLKRGNIRAIFAAVCAFGIKNGEIIRSTQHAKDTFDQINLYHEIVRRSKGQIEFLTNRSQISEVGKDKLFFLIMIEGADLLVENPAYLELMYNLDVRGIQLAWSFKNGLIGGCADQGGLTKLGKQIIAEMSERGMVLDVAHINRRSLNQVLDIVDQPFLMSHTNCKSVYDHPRNVDDDQLAAMADCGGYIGISGVPAFVSDEPTLDIMIDHYLHAIEICGVDRVLVGSDFGSMTFENLTKDFEQSSDMQKLVKGFRRRGLRESEIQKICHKNALKLLGSVLPE